MRMKVLACETLFRKIHLAAANSPHLCDVKFLSRECHDDLTLMRRMLEEELADTNAACSTEKRGVCCPACGNRSYDRSGDYRDGHDTPRALACLN